MSWHAAQVGFVIVGVVALAITLGLSARIVATTAWGHRRTRQR